MIISQTIWSYLLSIIFYIIAFFRVNSLIKKHFNINYFIFPLLFLLHPLSIEFITRPALVSCISFIILIEALNFYFKNQDEDISWIEMILFFTAGLINVNYALVPLILLKNIFKSNAFKKIFYFSYLGSITLFLFYNFAIERVNLASFIGYYTFNMFIPINLNFFTPALSITDPLYLSMAFLIFFYFFYKFEKDINHKKFLTIIPLIFFGSMFRQWDNKYTFWNLLIWQTSWYAPILLITLISLYKVLGKVSFNIIATFFIIINFIYLPQYFPISRYIETSIDALSTENTNNYITATRVHIRQLIEEKKIKEALLISKRLKTSYPNMSELEAEYKYLEYTYK